MTFAELVDLFGGIEDSILERLRDKKLAVRDFDISRDPEAIACPACNVALIDGVTRRVTNNVRGVTLTFSVTLVVQNVASEKERRRDSYALLAATMAYLSGYRPSGLSVKPFIVTRFERVYSSPTRIAFSIPVTVYFTFAGVSDEEDIDLTSIALDYYLKPGDAIADAQDIVETT